MVVSLLMRLRPERCCEKEELQFFVLIQEDRFLIIYRGKTKVADSTQIL